MFVLMTFVIAMALLGVRAEEFRRTPMIVAVISAVCAAMLYSMRFA